MKTNTLALAALLAIAMSGATMGRSPAAAQGPSGSSKPPSEADEAKAKAAFKQGNAQMDAKNYAQALQSYKGALAILPDNSTLLWNGGTAAFLARDYPSALGLWKRLKQLEPRDGAVRAKLIQTYSAQKKTREREAERRELFALRTQSRKRNPKSPTLKEKFYCREQFASSGRDVLAYEFFELEGERARRYKFVVLKKGETKQDFTISLGSYTSTNAFAQELEGTKGSKAGRLFHLDGYYANGLHKTFGFFSKEPSYDQTRALVASILPGRKSPMSSSQRGR